MRAAGTTERVVIRIAGRAVLDETVDGAVLVRFALIFAAFDSHVDGQAACALEYRRNLLGIGWHDKPEAREVAFEE